MTANTSPVWALTPVASPVSVTAANTKSNGDGTIGTDIFLAYTAGANGGWVSKVRLTPSATSSPTNTAATVLRIYLSTKTSGATTGGTDTFLIAEQAVPSVSADNSSQGVPCVDVPLNLAIPTGYSLLVSTHAAPAANTSQHAVVFGGDY